MDANHSNCRVTEDNWRSIHVDYIQFTFQSYLLSKTNESDPYSRVFLDRNIVDAIRYAYDCLEASIEFIYHMGLNRQLSIELYDNWLSRNIKRKWKNLSLSDRFGMLTFAWTGASFWTNPQQHQLFQDLKKVRDGLTHPIPFGTSIEKEIIKERELENGIIQTESKHIGDPKDLKRNWLTSSSAIAKFENNPLYFTVNDAEKAVEILIQHLIRLEKIFFKYPSTWFAVWNNKSKSIMQLSEILEKIECRYNDIWVE